MLYFAQCIDGGPIKIGSSSNVNARLRQLESHYGKQLALLATLPGGRDEERAIHKRFAHLRFGRTEQFQPARELMEFLSRPLLVSPNPDAVEALNMEKIDVRLRMSEDMYRRVQKVAERDGNPVAAFIRTVVIREVERREKEVAE